MSDVVRRIRDNLDRVRGRMADACDRAGRKPDEVQLIAVTKYVDAQVARLIVEAGCDTLAESRPQSLWEKADLLRETKISWHVIGHLQRNKVRRTLPLVTLIHSVDSRRLIDAIAAEAASCKHDVDVLLEVNISGDTSKHGLPPDDVSELLAHAAAQAKLNVRGLMAMAGRGTDADAARRQFASLRQLRDRLASTTTGSKSLPELSMGMSHDFEAAIAEGATLIRVGSALFEGISA